MLEKIATNWLQAFNNHDLENLLSLYDEKAQHYSPKLKIKFPETQGLIVGKEELRKWWKDALERLPTLYYQVTSLTANEKQVFMEYVRIVDGEPNMLVAEVLEIENNLIVKSRVYHG
ncbi:MAG: nuclear transport factor 2 family protein [Sphingobacteriaceae bacterium]|nr:nuclear transport factor 2 family protein [Sphingobacteriaceae bacterium]